jgi:imidazolonepropionase-like amidohydrolase
MRGWVSMIVRCVVLFTPFEELRNVDVLIKGEKIKEVRPSRTKNDDDVIEAEYVIPGLIDPHTHIGLYRLEGEAGDHGFEVSDPVTPHLNVSDAVDLFDPAFKDALLAGITCVGILPGSYMSFGSSVERITIMPGQGSVYKTNGSLVERTACIKAAVGEHPKRFLSEQKAVPTTRMGIVAELRAILTKAKEYAESEKKDKKDPKLEALIPLLKGQIPLRVHVHVERDIQTVLRLANEFGIRVVLDHATEAYMLSDSLQDVPIVYGPTVFARRGVELKNLDSANLSKMKGLQFSLTTDHPTIPIQYLDLLCSLALAHGYSLKEALQLVTINAARVLGLEGRIGSVEVGKDADLVLLSGAPLAPETKVLMTIIDGEIVFKAGEHE